MILFWHSIHFSDFFLEIMTELQKDIFTIWIFVSDDATLVIELSSKLCWFCCSSMTLQGISFHQFHLFFSVTFRKEVGLTKFIPKAVLENMKVSLCNKCVHVQAVFVYPVVMKLKVNYCQNQKIFFLGCFYMWLHVSTHLQGMLSNTNCGTLSFVRTVLSHACDWSA